MESMLHMELSDRVLRAAIEVHRVLGPGLLESTYEACLFDELQHCGLRVLRQVELPVIFKDRKIDCGYRIDLLVEDLIVMEIKSVEKLAPIHTAQLMTYLRLSGREVGLLMNFNVPLLKDGVIRRALSNPSVPSAFSALNSLEGALNVR